MKDLIERLRSRYLDTKQMLPNKLCHEAADALEQQAAVIEQMREALFTCEIKRIWDEAKRVKATCKTYDIKKVAEALALQLAQEGLAKVKADAVREVVERFVIPPSTQANAIYEYADSLLKGEM